MNESCSELTVEGSDQCHERLISLFLTSYIFQVCMTILWPLGAIGLKLVGSF